MPSRARFESKALSHPSGHRAVARHVVGNARADACAKLKRFGGSQCLVARSSDVGAGQLVARAACHPVQRAQRHIKCKRRLTSDVVARGAHEGLRVHSGTPRKRESQVVLFQRLGGGEPLALFAWCRSNQVAGDAVRLDSRVTFGDGAKGGRCSHAFRHDHRQAKTRCGCPAECPTADEAPPEW